MVVADAELRRMLAFEAFRNEHASDSHFAAWQKAARPLDGGLKVAKAQAQLGTRLRSPAEGLHAMREAIERGRPHVDQPGNMK